MLESAAVVPKNAPTRYTDDEFERGLRAVALCSGNTRRAASALKSQGLAVPRTTLQHWVTTHQERYLAAQKALEPQISTPAWLSGAKTSQTNSRTWRRSLSAWTLRLTS